MNMDFGNFLMMRQEVGLIAVFIILFFADIFTADKKDRGGLNLFACILYGAYTLFAFLPAPQGTAFGGMYETTAITGLMKAVLNFGTFIVFLQAQKWLRSPDVSIKAGEFYILTMTTLLGMFLMISSRNFMMLFIGIETASIPLACLAAYNKYKEKSAEAGAKYILMSAFASGILMFGISFLYGASGTLYFSDMIGITSNPMTIVGLVFFFAGLGFKLSLVPFHFWTADVYEGAPTSVTAYLSVVSKGAAAFALMFSLFYVFGSMFEVWRDIIWWLAIITITVGNLFAMRQSDLKRFFAFSSISQAGYLLIGLIAGSEQGMTATVFYVLVYLFSNMAIFGVIAALEKNSENISFSSINGLYSSNPRLAFVMMVAVFSLAGIPPFAGFFSKFFIFAAAAAEGEYLLVFIALLNTVVSLFYYLQVIKAMFIKPADELSVGHTKADGYSKVGLIICTAGVLLLGFISIIYEYITSNSGGMIG